MATKDEQKTVLVSFKNHKRLLTYTGGVDELKERVYQVFHDVLFAGTNIFLQIQNRDPEWRGEYLDLQDQDVPDKSWKKVCLHNDSLSVASEPIATIESRSSDQVKCV